MGERKDTWNDSITDEAPSSADEVRTLYDDFAHTYDEAVDAWGYVAPDVVADYLARFVSSTAEVLDAGCGTGLTGAALSSLGFSHLVGTDLSADSLRLADQSGHYAALHELDLTQNLPFAPSTFEGVVCVGVFSYIPDVRPVLREFLRVLQPGGTLVFTQREDHFIRFDSARRFNELHLEGGFDRLEETSPQPYLPGNPSFANNIGVHYCIWRKHGR